MPKKLCTNCHSCRMEIDGKVDCEAAGGIVKAVFRKEVKGGRYDQCPNKLRAIHSSRPSQLQMLHFLVRLFSRVKDGEILSKPERLDPDEIKSLEEQLKERLWYPISIVH